MPDRRLVYFLVCDFARIEQGTNKGIFIGAYSTSIVPSAFPALLPSLAFVACFEGLSAREKVTVAIKFPGLDEVSQVQELPAEQRDSYNLMLHVIPCSLPQAGRILVEYRFQDGTVERTHIDVRAAGGLA